MTPEPLVCVTSAMIPQGGAQFLVLCTARLKSTSKSQLQRAKRGYRGREGVRLGTRSSWPAGDLRPQVAGEDSVPGTDGIRWYLDHGQLQCGGRQASGEQ